ncbi:hypothetical protein F8568_017545 [Actinomadura sp. LD22]|uniref:Uncharacterized protein n=1 Tax=Actinomadura physcomitrii TaxID=2650748 RepID=A0A6I4MIU3_9ACTN|nr:hypothetical protein [Actinomadura physcomitrii]MWA02146.1 hypothetical protein [Actinomadura physcomitrii]
MPVPLQSVALDPRPGAVGAHPGAVDAHPGAVDAHPGAVDAHPGAVDAHPTSPAEAPAAEQAPLPRLGLAARPSRPDCPSPLTHHTLNGPQLDAEARTDVVG